MSLLWPILLTPAGVGALLALLGPRTGRTAPAVAVLTTAATLGLVAGAGTQQRTSVPFLLGAPFELGLDGLSSALAVTVCVVTLCVLAAVPGQVPERRGRLCGWLLLFLFAVLLTLTARSLLPLLVGWELMGAASYLLIAHDVADPHAARSATTALLTTRALDLGLYLAAGAALAGGGTLALDGLSALPAGWRDAAALGIVAAALGKAAQLPVSFWLSRAMDGPSPVSALLHSAAMVAMGGYLLLRTAPLLTATGWADDAVAWTGATTAVLLGIVALAQRDLKQLLAASTASQLGFVVLAAGLSAREAGAAQLVAHASVKSLLFLVAGLWLHELGTRDLGALRGAALRTPAVGVLAVVGLASLAGLPPLALWGTKDAVLDAALQHSVPLYAAGLLAAVLSAAYAGRVLVLVLAVDRQPDRAPVSPRVRVPTTSWVPLLPLAAGAALLVALAVGRPAELFGELVGREPVQTSAAGLGLAALLAVAVLALMRSQGEALAARLSGAPLHWLHLEPAVRAIAVRPVLQLSRALATFDDSVLDRAVESAAAGTVRAATAARRLDERDLDGGVRAIASLTQRLGALARRLQTGQVHHYYGQAAALLVAATVLLLLVR